MGFCDLLSVAGDVDLRRAARTVARYGDFRFQTDALDRCYLAAHSCNHIYRPHHDRKAEMTPGEVAIGWTSMILPFIAIGAVAILIPLCLARHMPENFGALFLNAFLSIAICFLMAEVFFLFEFRRLGASWGALKSEAGAAHVLRLSAMSGIFWGPLVLLSVLSRPMAWRPDL